jgi:hypothetical protein
MSDDRGYKFQSALFTLPAATPAGAVRKTIIVDDVAQKVMGICLRTIKDGTIGYVGVGVQDENEVYIDVQSSKNFEPGSGAGLTMAEQFKAVDIPGSGNRLSFTIKTIEAVPAGQEVMLEFTLLLKRKPLNQ